jgi:hemerythrin-like domain-containing protein
MKLREVVNIKPILRVIDFQSEDKNLIDEYVIMDQTVEYFTKILEGFTQVRDEETTSKEGSIQPGRADRCHKITGTYGVGKSYFILMLRAMLESLEDENSYNSIMHKFGDFKSVAYQLEILKREAKKYIVISINGKSFSELDFKSLIEDRVYKTILEKIGRENLNFDSFFESTVNQLEEWRKTNSVLYKVFEEKFRDDIDYTYDEMIEDLAKRENGAKEKYIKVYKDIINREPSNTFDSLDKFLDEANENVINNGYDGIVILFDEFSTYLRSRAEKGYLNIDLGSIDILAERTIPSSTRKIHFITTEHEDIEKILEKVLDNMDTVKKTAGRFKNYTLHFEKGAQLVQSVVAKNDNKFKLVKFENSNIFDEYSKVNDYAQLSDIYPINPFTLEYLVKISEKYAQGDRTLFSFIDEKLRAFVENKQCSA